MHTLQASLTRLWLMGQVLQYLLPQIICTIVMDRNGEEAKQKIDATDMGLQFEGNTSAPDYFRLLERDGDYLLIGARNIVYNISIYNFDVQTNDCHNYIRILAKENQTDLLVCGTNAFKPTCRRYTYRNGAYEVTSEFLARGLTPYDTAHPSTALYVPETGEVYAGTVADFSATDALIYKRNIANPDELGLRTERSDINCLNVAQVCKRDHGGSRSSAPGSWTSFAKLRLNCSLSGDFPFYFDEIVATSSIVQRSMPYSTKSTYDDSEFVYGVFETPFNKAVGGSAVCAFSMKEIRNAFRHRPFKSQMAANSNWQQVPRPEGVGDCNVNSSFISAETVNFVRKNFLIDAVLPNYFNSPLIVQTGPRRFTQIVVDPQVIAVDGKRYDVIFLAADDGRILKLVNLMGASERFYNETAIDQAASFTVLISIIKIYDNFKAAASNMQIIRSASTEIDAHLIVVSDEVVRSVPLYHCAKAITCHSCVQLQDPYCAWDRQIRECVKWNARSLDDRYVQNVTGGYSRVCFDAYNADDNPPADTVNSNSQMKNSTVNSDVNLPGVCKYPLKGTSSDNGASNRHGSYDSTEQTAGYLLSPTTRNSYSIETLITVILVASSVSCMVGFIAGLRLYKSPVCSSHISAKGIAKCPSPTVNAEGTMSDRKLKFAVKCLFATRANRPNPSVGLINAYEYNPPRMGDYKYLNESVISTTNNSVGTPDYCNKTSCCKTLSRDESTVHSATMSPPSAGLADVALSPTSAYCTNNVTSTNGCSNYSTLPKDYRVKKTYL